MANIRQWAGIGHRSFDSAQALRDSGPGVAGETRDTSGALAAGDGGGGAWRWDAASTADDDLGTVLLPAGHVGAGRWVRIIEGSIDVQAFGVIADGLADCTLQTQAAVVATAGVCRLHFPSGDYAFAHNGTVRQLNLITGSHLYGDGPSTRLIVNEDPSQLTGSPFGAGSLSIFNLSESSIAVTTWSIGLPAITIASGHNFEAGDVLLLLGDQNLSDVVGQFVPAEFHVARVVAVAGNIVTVDCEPPRAISGTVTARNLTKDFGCVADVIIRDMAFYSESGKFLSLQGIYNWTVENIHIERARMLMNGNAICYSRFKNISGNFEYNIVEMATCSYRSTFEDSLATHIAPLATKSHLPYIIALHEFACECKASNVRARIDTADHSLWTSGRVLYAENYSRIEDCEVIAAPSATPVFDHGMVGWTNKSNIDSKGVVYRGNTIDVDVLGGLLYIGGTSGRPGGSADLLACDNTLRGKCTSPLWFGDADLFSGAAVLRNSFTPRTFGGGNVHAGLMQGGSGPNNIDAQISGNSGLTVPFTRYIGHPRHNRRPGANALRAGYDRQLNVTATPYEFSLTIPEQAATGLSWWNSDGVRVIGEVNIPGGTTLTIRTLFDGAELETATVTGGNWTEIEVRVIQVMTSPYTVACSIAARNASGVVIQSATTLLNLGQGGELTVELSSTATVPLSWIKSDFLLFGDDSF